MRAKRTYRVYIARTIKKNGVFVAFRETCALLSDCSDYLPSRKICALGRLFAARGAAARISRRHVRHLCRNAAKDAMAFDCMVDCCLLPPKHNINVLARNAAALLLSTPCAFFVSRLYVFGISFLFVLVCLFSFISLFVSYLAFCFLSSLCCYFLFCFLFLSCSFLCFLDD